MGKDNTEQKSAPGTRDMSTILMAFKTIADTTWRIFTPVLLFLSGGLLLDWQYNTLPWFMLGGTVLGAVVAVWLITRLYQRAKKEGPNV